MKTNKKTLRLTEAEMRKLGTAYHKKLKLQKALYYGVFGTQVCPEMITPDKQLHGGPYPIFGRKKDLFFFAAGLINWLERQCPNETFTMVIDEFKIFNNNYWRNAPNE